MRVKIEATFGMKSDRMEVTLLRDVFVDGVFFRNHIWIAYDRFAMKDFSGGEKITFTAKENRYIGLGKNQEYVEKIGFNALKNIKEIK